MDPGYPLYFQRLNTGMTTFPSHHQAPDADPPPNPTPSCGRYNEPEYDRRPFIPITLKDDPTASRSGLEAVPGHGIPEQVEKHDLIALRSTSGGGQQRAHPSRYAAVVSREITRSWETLFHRHNTLYVGRRANAVDHLMLAPSMGSPRALGAPVLIADGLLGTRGQVRIDGKHFKDVPSPELAFARGW